MMVHDLHTEKHHHAYRYNIVQPPCRFSREQITEKSCKEACGDAEKNREECRPIPEDGNMKYKFNIGKDKCKINRCQQTAEPGPLLALCRRLAFYSFHQEPPKNKIIHYNTQRKENNRKKMKNEYEHETVS